MREKTIAYFLSEITKSFGNGDCILLENIDSNGNITHALIDTGRKINNGVVCKFLEKHNVQKLVFLCITHSHGDHNGDTISVLDKYKVDLLIMKEYDLFWCADGTQKTYENILSKAIEKNIKVLGVSFESLGSKEYSPSQSENFITVAKDAKKENFEYFNENNVSFGFGSADIKIMNWQIFDSEGNLFVTGQKNKDGVYRDIYPWENENSLGILLYQGDKKAFFSGDMNNLLKNVGGEKIGDEDRLKKEIGKVDLLKLGHHGYQNSNTNDYINVLLPNFAVITNDVGREYVEITNFLEKNKVNYLFTTQDEYEICATIYNDEVTLGFGTSGIKRVKDEIFYIPEDKIYSNYLNCKYPVNYEVVEKSVTNWEELKKLIEGNQKNGTFDSTEKCFTTQSLKIILDEGDNDVYVADSSINIRYYQKIQLISKDKEITIKRDKNLAKLPLFKVENGIFILGEESMKGKIVLDGNKENVVSSSHLIQLINSEFAMYNNVTLCNNLFRISKKTKEPTEFGSALHAIDNSKINIYGGEISNNINEVYIPKDNKASILPVTMENSYSYDSRGAGIYLNSSILYFSGGIICNNEGINNTDIYSNQNSTNNNNPKTLTLSQRCLGIGIFVDNKSSIYLQKGEISNNKATNNAKSNFITPNDNNKKTNINTLYNCIYGSAIYVNNSNFEMKKDFIIQNNSSTLSTTINIQKNCLINNLHSAIRGGQIYMNSSAINIQGGTIQNSNNSSKVESNIEPDEQGKVKTISTDTIGGAINTLSCNAFQISNLKIIKCKAKNGGAIYFGNSIGKISNSEFTDNEAQSFGGAIYMNTSSQIELYNSKVLNNKTQDGSGGGIYAQGYLIITGKNSSVSQNTAGTFGGGIIFKSKGLIKYCIIYKNKALKNSGGGIRNDGNLVLEDGKIYSNWCKEYGGGISNCKELSYDKNKINNIVYDNTADKGGNNLYPEK